jgi:hypothetical protein
MKIYLDDFFYYLCQHSTTATHFQNINEIPNDCDIVAVSFYNNYWHEHLQTIQELSTRTKKLLINLSEPTPGNMNFTTFVDSIDHDNVYLFSDVTFNYTPKANIETIVSWFIGSENFYATQSWASDRMIQLDKVLQRHRLLSPSQLALGNATKNMYLVLPRPMMFDCLLGIQRPHRDIIQTCYTNSQCRDKILFSYYKNNDNITQGIWDQDIDQFEGTSASRYALLPLSIYNQTYYSIVAETTTENSYNQYTEKVAKPIIAGRPFVVFAGKNYLSNLRQLGFKTFASVVDESYDTIADLHQRMTAAWHQVEWLCEQDPEHVYRELHEVLQHNRQHFLTTDWHKAIRKHF